MAEYHMIRIKKSMWEEFEERSKVSFGRSASHLVREALSAYLINTIPVKSKTKKRKGKKIYLYLKNEGVFRWIYSDEEGEFFKFIQDRVKLNQIQESFQHILFDADDEPDEAGLVLVNAAEEVYWALEEDIQRFQSLMEKKNGQNTSDSTDHEDNQE